MLTCLVAARRQTAASAAASERGHYLTMMSARIALVGGAAGSLGRAATIAIRYSLVRRQGFQSSSATGGSFRAPENQIIDYRMNQYVRLLTAWLPPCMRRRRCSAR